LWLFGGYGAGAVLSPTDFEGDLNDLWEYGDGKWTWVSGSDGTEQPGIYGALGTAGSGNIPGARYQAASWTDAAGNFWLFGGLGIDSTATRGDLDDLWKYSNGEWTWMGGSKLAAEPGIAGAFQGAGVYGTQGVATSTNFPGARVGASTWTDSLGNLWLFGGFGVDSNGTLGDLNDLWKFNAGQWTWVKGSKIADQSGAPQYGVYGTLGVRDPANTPGARFGAASWTDSSGNLWLFGGNGEDVNGQRCQQTLVCDLSDLWEYSGGEWAWKGGPNQVDEPGIYGTQGAAAAGNIPQPRDLALAWSDNAGTFWLFGGVDGIQELSDLWKFSDGEWTWVNGPNSANELGSYGTMGAASAANQPACRHWAVGWADKSGNLWMFGGDDSLGIAHGGKFNDLWQYRP